MLERVAVVDRRVERRRQQVVRGRHRVEVAVEVEVDVLHRHDLRVAAAGAAALDAEDRAHRRLAQAEHHLLADLAEALRQRDAGRRLAFAGLGRRDRGGDHELAVRALGEAVQDRQRRPCPVRAVRPELLGLDARRRGDLRRSGAADAAWAISSPDSMCERSLGRRAHRTLAQGGPRPRIAARGCDCRSGLAQEPILEAMAAPEQVRRNVTPVRVVALRGGRRGRNGLTRSPPRSRWRSARRAPARTRSGSR